MDQREIRVLLQTYNDWAKMLCAPVFWWDANDRMHNGSMTFLRTKSHVLGVTNAHVADSIANSTRICQMGGADFDRGRFIARHPTMDLATFRLSDQILAPAGNHHAATVQSWPPTRPIEGDLIMLGGYPSIFHAERPDEVDFYFAWFIGDISSSSDRHVGVVLNIEKSKSISSRRIPANADLGGWSGGPVFRVINSDGIERLELAAIIYEYTPEYEIALAHPLSDLAEDGTFSNF